MKIKVQVLYTKVKLHVLTSSYWYHMKGKMNLKCNKTMQPFQTFEDLDHKLFANKLMKYFIKALQNQQS